MTPKMEMSRLQSWWRKSMWNIAAYGSISDDADDATW